MSYLFFVALTVCAMSCFDVAAALPSDSPPTLFPPAQVQAVFPSMDKQQKLFAQYTSLSEFESHVATYFTSGISGGGCHNATGACLSNNDDSNAAPRYLCVNGETVAWSDRCDGLEDCSDGSDELMCHLSPKPISEHKEGSLHHRRFHEMFAAATCNGCACQIGSEASVSVGNPYYEMAIVSKMTADFSDEIPQGKRCNPLLTTSLMMKLYKKSGFCRKAICCVRQSGCVRCNSTTVTARPGKCWEKVANATEAPEPTTAKSS